MAPAPSSLTVRLWAGARAAAGTGSLQVEVDGPVSVAWLAAETVRRAPAEGGRERLAQVLGMCSVLVGDRPLGSAPREGAMVAPGETVEFLPPFAGG